MSFLTFGKIGRDQLLLARIVCVGLVALFALCVAITSKILQSRFDGHCILYAKVLPTSSERSFLLSEGGNQSTCQFINVLSELILISCPFLVILVFVERKIEPFSASAVLCRRAINIFTLLFSILVLVQACLSSVGFSKLCKALKENEASTCNQNIRYFTFDMPCLSEENCSTPRSRDVEFLSVLVCLECLSWMLFFSFSDFQHRQCRNSTG